MAIAFVNRTAGAGGAGSNTAIAATAAVHTAGNLLVAVMALGAETVFPTVTDTAGNTWHPVTGTPYLPNSTNYLSIAYAYNCLGNATNVVTATHPSATSFNEIIVLQFSGALTTDPIRDAANATGNSAAAATAAIGASGDAICLVCVAQGQPTGSDPTYTIHVDDTFFADGYAVATGAQTATCAVNSNTWGIAAASFKPAAAGPVNTVLPAVTGTAKDGRTLTCSTGTWTGDVSSGYAYQWQRDGYGDLSFANIPGATSSTYLESIADVDCDLQCVVTATGTGGSTSATSNVVGPVTAASASGRHRRIPDDHPDIFYPLAFA